VSEGLIAVHCVLEVDEIFDQFPSIKIEIDPAGPADPGSGLYYETKRAFEGVHFL